MDPTLPLTSEKRRMVFPLLDCFLGRGRCLALDLLWSDLLPELSHSKKDEIS